MLFLGWLLASFLVVGAINLYLRHFGLPRSRTTKQNGSVGSFSSFGSASRATGTFGRGTGTFTSAFGGGGSGGDGANWINATIAWIYQRCHQTPDVVDTWLKSLTTEAEKQSKDIQFRFDGIHGSPPEISNIRADDSNSESFTIFANLVLKDVTLRLSSVASASRNAINCDVYLYNLKGQMKIVTKCINRNEISQLASFISPPEMKLQIRPGRVDMTLDTANIEKIARAAITGATTNLTWTSSSIKPGVASLSDGNRNAIVHESVTSQRQTSLGSSVTSRPFREQPAISLNQPLQTISQHYDVNTPTNVIISQDGITPQNDVMAPSFDLLRGTQPGFSSATVTTPTVTPPSGSSSKLLVRVIKANGLIDTDFGSCSAYCAVIVENPPQNFTTNFVKNTVNPYWDEQFVFETNSGTKQIQMEVLDREREPGNELLGKASVLLDEIRRMPSSRQIIPLTGKPRSRTSTSGSITVEFVFMDSLQPPLDQTQQKISARSNMNEPQSRYQEKAEMQGMTADYSPHSNNRHTMAPLSAHNLALSTGVPSGVLRINEAPTVVVTGVETQKFNTLQPSHLNSGGIQAGATPKKKESLASTLKKKFNKIRQPRSQSADRATGNRTVPEGNLLKLPSDRSATLQVSETKQGDTQNLYGEGMTKPRSNSFSSSLRRIFKREKKDASRESLTTKPNTNLADPYNRQLSISQQEAMDRSRRQNSPVPIEIQYSVSVPSGPSPLQSR